MANLKRTWEKAASAVNNVDFILVETYSGYSNVYVDPQGKRIYLEPDVDNLTLGQAVLEALNASRIIPAEEAYDFGDFGWRSNMYKEWIQSAMNKFGYKTKRALFKNMDNCGIKMLGDKITMHPRHHEKLEAWSATENGDKDNVIIPADSSPEEIGAALRLAFSRCTSAVS